jgi:hypothetical protein
MFAALLDFEGAFNAVWHDGLRFKLAACGAIPDQVVRWLSAFLNARTFLVRVGVSFSQPNSIGAGVPQGSPLSPILFSFFSADLASDGELMAARLATFADDVTAIDSAIAPDRAKSRIQQTLNEIAVWSLRWRLPLSPSKCMIIRFGKPVQNMDFFIGDTKLPVVDEARYLGVMFTTSMTWEKHFKLVAEKASTAVNALRRVSYPGSPVSTESRRILYQTMIRPIMEYSCPAFMDASNAQFERLEKVEHEALRCIAGVRRVDRISIEKLYQLANIEPLRQRMVKLSERCVVRWWSSVPIVAEILERDKGDVVVHGTPLGCFVKAVPYGPRIGW